MDTKKARAPEEGPKLCDKNSARSLKEPEDYGAKNLARIPQQPLQKHPEQSELAQIIDRALQQQRSAGELDQLYQLYEKMAGKAAEREFNAAFARFRAECPPIPRRQKSDQFNRVNREGVRVPYSYAALEDIAGVVDPILSANGLSYRWTDAALEPDGGITIRCVISHTAGHSESSAVTVPQDQRENKLPSAMQKAGVVWTYARRLSLISALGLTTVDEDNDGADPEGEPTYISQEQVDDLRDKIQAKRVDVEKFCQYFKVESVNDLQTRDLPRALQLIAKKGGDS